MRALPAKAGDALVWTGRLLHFGGRASAKAQIPRISLAIAFSSERLEAKRTRKMKLEFESIDSPANAQNRRLRMPTLEERLRVVTIQLLGYSVELSDAERQVLQRLNAHKKWWSDFAMDQVSQ